MQFDPIRKIAIPSASNPVSLGLVAPDDPADTIEILELPELGAVRLAGGGAVQVGQMLTGAQLASLIYAAPASGAGPDRFSVLITEAETSRRSEDSVDLIVTGRAQGASLFFSAEDRGFGRELWRLDNTDTAIRVTDLNIGIQDSNVSVLGAFDGRMYFNAKATQDDGRDDTGIELFRIDGNGAVQSLGDLDPGPGSSSPRSFFEHGTELYFIATTPETGNELWRVTDGGGTELAFDIAPGAEGSNPGFLTPFAGAVYFRASTPASGTELWRLTADHRVQQVADIFPGEQNGSIGELAEAGGLLYFAASAPGEGNQIWSVNAELAVRQVTDGDDIGPDILPRSLVSFNDTLHFLADKRDLGRNYDLYRLAGTDETEEVHDIDEGGIRSQIFGDPVVFDGALYYDVDTRDTGRELFRALPDGTSELVADIAPGRPGSGPRDLSIFDGALWFRADDGVNGAELWRLDADDDLQMFDLFPGAESSNPSALTVWRGAAYFTAKGDEATGTEIWRMDSDLTAQRVADIKDGAGTSGARDFTPFGFAGTTFLPHGSVQDDLLIGSAADDATDASRGDDTLRGEGGNDTLMGGDGSDIVDGGAGNDVLSGGTTEDDLRDRMFGGGGDDDIDAGHGNDLVYGGAGDDTIAGGFGVDEVIGQAGDDVLTGSAFSDLIFGGDGADFINGGFGHDRVNGGAGADRFFHIGQAGHGSDWIQEYAAAQGDVLLYGGAARADQFQINYANTANAGDAGVDEAFIIYRPTGQILWALVDGAGQDSINLQVGGQVFDLMG